MIKTIGVKISCSLVKFQFLILIFNALSDSDLKPNVHDVRNLSEISDKEKINKSHLNNLIS